MQSRLRGGKNPHRGPQEWPAYAGRSLVRLFLYAESEFFDHRVGEHLAGDALNLSVRGLGRETVSKRKREILTLAHGDYIRESDLAQGVLNGLALRIQD